MKRLIVFGIMLILLAICSSTTMVANSATGASIVISPDTTTSPHGTFMLNLAINDVADMYAWSVTLVYQKIIDLNFVVAVNSTTFFNGAFISFKQEDYNSSCFRGYVFETLLNGAPGVTGSGLVAQLNFIANSNGVTAISCIDSEILNSQSKDITPITVTTPTVTVATAKPSPVGGISFSVAKPAFPVPYIGLASIAIVAIVAATIYFKGIKRRKEKQ